jgi:ubiquitin-protein ligase E3 C
VSEEIGNRTTDELKSGGADIPVTKDNRIEYIHLMADYKLNRQIKSQCNAFRQGLSDVINLDWLRMFSTREVQTLISGSETEIDIDDLRAHTKYGNGFSEEHPTIVMFWDVVQSLSEERKRRLLKFVTSCSRPPLLGFKVCGSIK